MAQISLDAEVLQDIIDNAQDLDELKTELATLIAGDSGETTPEEFAAMSNAQRNQLFKKDPDRYRELIAK